ncbi:MAG TPA: ribosome rescue protein RqcH, partial [Candidatus Thermoplasmatota archaeon]|nr:ribosome rescue protein RqcH [Candidatus Thermoplasmatota archaeon]
TYDLFRPRFLASQADAVRTLATEFDIGPLYAEEVCARARVPKNKPVVDLAEGEVQGLFDALRGILDQFAEGRFEPVLVLKGEEKTDASPIPLVLHERYTRVPQPSFNAALDALWGRGPAAEKKPEEDPRLVKWREEKARIERQLAQQTAALRKFEKEETEARAKGDLLYGHFDLVNRVRDIILKASKDLGWAEVQTRLKAGKAAGNPEAAAVDTLNPNEGWIILALPNLEGKQEKVRFELTKTVQENAEDFYDKAKKMREKQEGAKTALVITQGKLAEMEKHGLALVTQLTEAAQRAPPTKRFWFEGYRWFITSEGNLVMGGRDATTNDKLIKKHLDDTDRYVHADLNGAPSCVVKPNAQGVIPEKSLQEAGQFAAVMSRAWINGLANVDAYWVTPLQVSKTPQPGEFLAKGAFIIRGKRNFMQARLRAAVGEIAWEGARKIMGGPPEAVLARAKRYVVLEPGDRDRNKLAAELAKAFHVPVEEIQAVMPPGDVRVVEAVGVDIR